MKKYWCLLFCLLIYSSSIIITGHEKYKSKAQCQAELEEFRKDSLQTIFDQQDRYAYVKQHNDMLMERNDELEEKVHELSDKNKKLKDELADARYWRDNCAQIATLCCSFNLFCLFPYIKPNDQKTE